MSKTRALALLAVLIVAILGGGCSSSSSSGGASSGSTAGCVAVGSSYTVVAKDLSFQTTAGKPITCMTAKAGTVTFTLDNKDAVAHDLAINGNGGKEQKTELKPGPVTQTLKAVLKKGTYGFSCTIHANMKGTLTVS